MTPGAQLASLIVLACALLGVAVWVALKMVQGSPEKRERNRRLMVNRYGRLADAFITEAGANIIYYEYSVHGVRYIASQDVTLLRELLPSEPERLIGVVNLKYTPRNPANSILVCEEWSGLRSPGSHRAAS
jgi:hypothetical protein